MNYQETIDFLFNQFPAFQKDGSSAYKPGLERILDLSAIANNPHLKFKSIHVAGTNGKGSCSHMLASILQEAGYRVGLFTSPHLKDFRERIKINGEEISEAKVIDFVDRFQSQAKDIKPSFFEYTTVMAFEYFANEKVDIAIIETGLGGRLDCSNIITPEVSVITNIGLDHVQFLGNDLGSIAKEKAGIIKHKAPVVVGRKQGATVTVFDYFASINQTDIVWAEELKEIYASDLKGNYQSENIKTVAATVQRLSEEWKVPQEAIENGLLKVQQNTGLKGRWQVLGTSPKIICDTGHNEDGVKSIVSQLKEEPHDQLHIVWGMVNDKDASAILALLPKTAKYYWVKPDINRALDQDALKASAEQFNLKGESYSSVNAALETAKRNSSNQDVIFVGGSTFVVAEVV